MKKLFLIISLSLFSRLTFATACGEGDILIDISGYGAKGETEEGSIKIIDASKLKVRGKDTPLANPLDTTGVVSRKAVCVGKLYCFVARRYMNEKSETKFRWEAYRKDNPIAEAGTHSLIFVKKEFETSVKSPNAPLKISNSPLVFAQRKENVSIDFRRVGDSNRPDISFSLAIQEKKIEIRGYGQDQTPRIDLNLQSRSEPKKENLSAAQPIVFRPFEQAAYEREIQDIQDPVTKKFNPKALKLKPIDPIAKNCLRQEFEKGDRDVFKMVNGQGTGSAK